MKTKNKLTNFKKTSINFKTNHNVKQKIFLEVLKYIKTLRY